jgi:hypothetical protein
VEQQIGDFVNQVRSVCLELDGCLGDFGGLLLDLGTDPRCSAVEQLNDVRVPGTLAAPRLDHLHQGFQN